MSFEIIVLKAGREGLWRTTKGAEFRVCAANKQKAGRTTMLFSLVGGDAKNSAIGTKAYRSRSDVNVDKFLQVVRCSASDDLIAETRCLVSDSLFYREPVQWFKGRFAVFCST